MSDEGSGNIRLAVVMAAVALLERPLTFLANLRRGHCSECRAQIESDRFARLGVCSRRCRNTKRERSL